jgi:hypothetical protein
MLQYLSIMKMLSWINSKQGSEVFPRQQKPAEQHWQYFDELFRKKVAKMELKFFRRV